MTIRVMFALLCALFWTTAADAQGLQRVPSCGTGTPGPGMSPGTQDTTGNGCVSGTFAPGSLTQVTLDIKTVTTGGTAVNALSAGHRNKGGWLKNPDAAAASLCINEIGAASGTVSSGDTTCIAPGQTYTISPGIGPVSVISSDSAHPFSGLGYN